MINILFALIAVGAMCIDIVLNRGIIEEINDECEEHKKNLEEAFSKTKFPAEKSKNSRDNVEGLINKVRELAKGGCASKKAKPFYITIIVLSVCVVILALAENIYKFIGSGECENLYKYLELVNINDITIQNAYTTLNNIISLLSFGILIYYIDRFHKIMIFHKDIEDRRRDIKAKVDKTIVYANLSTGNPAFLLDEKD